MTLTSSEQKDFFELKIKTRGLSMHRCLSLKTVYFQLNWVSLKEWLLNLGKRQYLPYYWSDKGLHKGSV